MSKKYAILLLLITRNYVKQINISTIMSYKIYVSFVIGTTEAVRLECRSGDNYAEKEIFCVDNRYYFFYIMNRNADTKTKTVSLREIDKKEYLARKAEIMSACPDKSTRNWTDGTNAYALKIFRNGVWKRILPSNQCIFTSETSPLKDICEAIVAQETMEREKEEALNSLAKKDYAQKCNSLSRMYGVSFVNVLRLGHDPEKLRCFHASYKQALAKVKVLPLRTLRRYYELLRTGRVNCRSALDELGVRYFDADVNIMDLSELLSSIHDRLNAYAEESLQQAIATGVAKNFEQRKEVYDKLCQTNRQIKRQALAELGIDLEAIEFKRYPIHLLKQKLAASLGIDLHVG